MTLAKFNPGVNTSFSSQLNGDFAEAYTIAALNLIRQLQDRSVTFSKGMIDWWGDAYIDSNGRMDSVTGGTASFETNKYRIPNTLAGLSGTLADPDAFTNPNNAFDSNSGTSAVKSHGASTSTVTTTLGKTFSARSVYYVYVSASSVVGGGSSNTNRVKLQSYNGSVWSDVATLASTSTNSASYDNIYLVNASIQGLRIEFNSTRASSQTATHTLTTLEEVTIAESTIIHTIPANTFSATISKAIGVPLFADWETGADIQYKLTNGSEDSGWLSCSNSPSISSFTAFTSQPTTLTVKLIPKSSSPTAGYPAIHGFVVRAA